MITIKFKPKILYRYFDNKVIEACKQCKRYNYKNTCPPKIDKIDYYKEVLPYYRNGKIIYKNFKVSNLNCWKELGRKSSLEIHNYLLKERNELIYNGNIFNIILGAGSCKMCSECSIPCKFPDKAIIPIEGTGINVINLMNHFNVEIQFPVEKYGNFFRIGMILWD